MKNIESQASETNSNFFNEACEFSNGVSWKACCYLDEFMQSVYYHSIFKNINFKFNSILDVGCGQGDLLNFMNNNFKFNFDYEGVDVSSKMIEQCNKKFPKNKFINSSFIDLKESKYDLITAVGCYNVKFAEKYDQINYLKSNIKKMYDMSNYACAFTLLSKYGYEDALSQEKLFTYEPSQIMEYCLGLTSSVVVDHSSIPIEFITILYKQ